MLKKMLSSLATFTLIAGSVTTTTAWTEHKNQNGGGAQKQNSQSSQDYNLNDDNLKKNKFFPERASIIYSLGYRGIIYVVVSIDSTPGWPDSLGALYESTDNGKTFTEDSSFKGYYVKFLHIYNDVLYAQVQKTAGGLTGLYERLINSNTFKHVDDIPNAFQPDVQMYGFNKIVFYMNDNSLWESTDNGKTWNINKSFPGEIPGEWDSIYWYNGILYDITLSGKLYESTDNGQTFTQNTSFSNINKK